MKKLILLFSIAIACSSPTPTAQEVVDQAIIFSGTKVLKSAEARFRFRAIDYEYKMDNGAYLYTRIQQDTLGNVVMDLLTNNGLIRTINGDTTSISEEKKAAYTSSVNSVIYFAFLPLWLNDAAVNKSYKGVTEIKDKTYYKIRVTFDQEGGGEDFEDVFYYWFDVDDYSMDYLAYSYEEEDGIGIRFREAYNQRRVNGVLIQDYINLKPVNKGSVPLEEIDQAYIDGELKELSLIELEDVEIILK